MYETMLCYYMKRETPINIAILPWFPFKEETCPPRGVRQLFSIILEFCSPVFRTRITTSSWAFARQSPKIFFTKFTKGLFRGFYGTFKWRKVTEKKNVENQMAFVTLFFLVIRSSLVSNWQIAPSGTNDAAGTHK